MKTKKLNIIEVECGELEATATEYFQEFYGFDPEEDEQRFYFKGDSYTVHDFYGINGELNSYEMEIIQKTIDTKSFSNDRYDFRVLLNYLCSKGIMESGDYLVRVPW
jgi:hypothetical protein